MNLVYQGATALSVLVFLYFGVTSVFANGMAAEFERFGLRHLRVFTGALELLGAIGLLAGQYIPDLVIVSAGGLALLMALGLFTRLRVRDALPYIIPAAVLLMTNTFIVWYALSLRSR